MALLPEPFHAGPLTIHTAEPPHVYDKSAEGRWDIRDLANKMPHEDLEAFRWRGWLFAEQWAREDAQQAAEAAAAVAKPAKAERPQAAPKQPSERGPGRPPVYPVIPGETPAQRRNRLARLRRAGELPEAPAHAQSHSMRALREGEVLGIYMEFDRTADRAWTPAERLVQFGMHISALTVQHNTHPTGDDA